MANCQFEKKQPEPFKKKVYWHLVMIGDHGKVVYLDKYRFTIFFGIIFLFVSAISAFVMFYFFFETRMRNQFLKEALEASQKISDSLKAENEILLTRLILAGVSPYLENEQSETVAGEKVNEPGVLSQTEKYFQRWPEHSDLVSITDFGVRHDSENNRLKLKFKFNNTANHRLRGYLFVILKNEHRPSDTWIVFPEASLENGIPSSYKSGKTFSIINFRNFEFETEKYNRLGPIFEAHILIFRNNGELILRQEFPVEIWLDDSGEFQWQKN